MTVFLLFRHGILDYPDEPATLNLHHLISMLYHVFCDGRDRGKDHLFDGILYILGREEVNVLIILIITWTTAF